MEVKCQTLLQQNPLVGGKIGHQFGEKMSENKDSGRFGPLTFRPVIFATIHRTVMLGYYSGDSHK